jgi:hypothetical protein
LSENETDLYDRALDEIVRYLAGMAEEMPA